MNINKMVTTVDAHTAGEPTRIVTGGIPHIPGSTMVEKKRWIAEHLDDLRRMLMWEPRGHQDMFGAILTEPVSEDAHAGAIFMDSGGYLDMCGHGSMGAATVLVDTGMVVAKDMETDGAKTIILDTPAGQVTAIVDIKGGSSGDVTVRNVPSFYYGSVSVYLQDYGSVLVNIAYGGNFFAMVDLKPMGLTLDGGALDQLKLLGMKIRREVNRQVEIVHPGTGAICQVGLTEFYEEGIPVKNMVVFGNGQIDRSPCGTGTCAKMAYLFHEGRLDLGEPYVHAGILNTEFTGRVIGQTRVGETQAIVPEIRGRAHITGFHQFAANDMDPFKHGFLLNDDFG